MAQEKEVYKPTGYNSVSPYFIVEGAQKFMELVKQIFQATELRRYEREDGSILHAEMQIDDSVIMIGDSSTQFPPNPVVIHVYVPNVDEVFKRAIELGCQSLDPPREREGDPDKRGEFRDFGGNLWSIATQVKK